MKKAILIAVAAILGINANAEQKVFIEDFAISAGETKTISLNLSNSDEIAEIQCDVYLPEGVTFTSLGDFNADRVENASGAFAQEKDAAEQGDGAIRFLVFPRLAWGSIAGFKGTEGAIVKFDVTAVSDLDDSQELAIEVKNIEATSTSLARFATDLGTMEETTAKVNSSQTLVREVGAEESAATARKFIKNSRIYISKGGKMFSTSGLQLK